MKLSKDQVTNAVETSISMVEAASKCKVHFATFKKYAKLYNVWNPNPGGKGTSKHKDYGKDKFSTIDILGGKHPQYSSHKLRIRLIKENLKENKCEECGITSWNGKKISMHLDHINGNHYDHSLENLRILCPNCHSQTHTYGNKNRNAPMVELVDMHDLESCA